MANANVSGTGKEYATVDTAPAAGGFWTASIGMREKRIPQVFFTIRGTGDAVVTLQFKCDGDTDWTDFNNDGVALVTGDNKVIEGSSANMLWRAGVKQGAYTSGSITFGFNWYVS